MRSPISWRAVSMRDCGLAKASSATRSPCGSAVRSRFARGDLHPWMFARRGKPFEAAVEGNFIVNNPSLAVKAAQDGLGLLQAHHDYVEQFLVKGQLVSVLEDWAPPPFDGFFLYYPSRRYIRLPLRAFIDFLRKEANVNPRFTSRAPR